jgi:hypothetical protein
LIYNNGNNKINSTKMQHQVQDHILLISFKLPKNVKCLPNQKTIILSNNHLKINSNTNITILSQPKIPNHPNPPQNKNHPILHLVNHSTPTISYQKNNSGKLPSIKIIKPSQTNLEKSISNPLEIPTPSSTTHPAGKMISMI